MFFHGTTEEAWAAIQAEGVLWGIPSKDCTYRYTYLTPSIDTACGFGCREEDQEVQVLLLVDYEPIGVGIRDSAGNAIDNYTHRRDHIEEQLADPDHYLHCWQFSVFKPIPLTQVRRI